MPFIVVHGEDQYFAVQTSTDLPCASTPFANGIMDSSTATSGVGAAALPSFSVGRFRHEDREKAGSRSAKGYGV